MNDILIAGLTTGLVLGGLGWMALDQIKLKRMGTYKWAIWFGLLSVLLVTTWLPAVK